MWPPLQAYSGYSGYSEQEAHPLEHTQEPGDGNQHYSSSSQGDEGTCSVPFTNNKGVAVSVSVTVTKEQVGEERVS